MSGWISEWKQAALRAASKGDLDELERLMDLMIVNHETRRRLAVHALDSLVWAPTDEEWARFKLHRKD